MLKLKKQAILKNIQHKESDYKNAVLYLKKAVDADSTFQLARDALKSIKKFIP